MIDLNPFQEWVRESGCRTVTIELGDATTSDYVKIWVYDYNMGVGQHVTSVDEIDLDAQYELCLKAQIESATKKLAKLREEG